MTNMTLKGGALDDFAIITLGEFSYDGLVIGFPITITWMIITLTLSYIK